MVSQEPAQKKRCGCGFCCCLLAVFLAVFFILPRTPAVWLDHVKFDSNTESGALEATGVFKLDNNNYFDVTWKEAQMSMYWLPWDQQGILAACSGSVTDATEACEFFQDGYCAIPLGTFTSADGDKYQTGSRDTKGVSLPLSMTSQQAACAAEMLVVASLNQGTNTQRLMTKGSMAAKATMRDFGRVHVSDTYYLI